MKELFSWNFKGGSRVLHIAEEDYLLLVEGFIAVKSLLAQDDVGGDPFLLIC